jgi:hypothetical protein
MPGGNFEEALEVVRDAAGASIVVARGPLDPQVTKVAVMCVWVLQRSVENEDDAISNAMGPEMSDMSGMPGMPGMPSTQTGGIPDRPDLPMGLLVENRGTPDASWTFLLTDRLGQAGGPIPVDFRAGSATAMAIGVFVDERGKQTGFFWAEPVRLFGPGCGGTSQN